MSIPSTVTRLEDHAEAIDAMIDAIAASISDAPTRHELLEIGSRLRALAARALPWSRLRLPVEEASRVHLLGLGAGDRVALYAVADRPGSSSVPHVHHTWSVTLGVEGIEVNTFFAHDGQRCLAALATQPIGPDDVAVMTAAEAHATEIVSSMPILHLHIYGRPIHVLAPFAARVLAPLA